MEPGMQLAHASNPQLLARTQNSPPLTRNQTKVLSVLLSLGRAAGAYELLDLLRDDGVNAIPTVYRALNELEVKGYVRHLRSTKSFVALDGEVEDDDANVMLVCETCKSVEPMRDHHVTASLKKNAAAAGFAIHFNHLELTGTCPSCLAEANERLVPSASTE